MHDEAKTQDVLSPFRGRPKRTITRGYDVFWCDDDDDDEGDDDDEHKYVFVCIDDVDEDDDDEYKYSTGKK